jgi:DNA modification methylase
MKVKKIEINKLQPASYNPRQISTKQYKDLKESIRKFDLVDPIIVNKDMTVIGGHQRLKVCKDLKHTEIDCVVLDLTKEEERELNIRLNKSGGEFDMDILANEFDVEELKEWGFKDIEFGFNIDKIVEGNTEDDHIPEVKESRVKLGDVWELGKHRLMCGDSTKESDVNKLMNGQKANVLITDPPYGMNFVSNYRKIKHKKIQNDQNINCLVWSINYEVDFCSYIFCRWNNLKDIKQPKSVITWVKNNWSMGDLKHEHARQSELILFYPSNKHLFPKERPTDIVNHIRTQNKLHPTQKPIKLMQEIINWTKGLIIDPFLGSGSTLIACEKTNRICYGMELDTKYCDVIIERWEQFTGQKANKITE